MDIAVWNDFILYQETSTQSGLRKRSLTRLKFCLQMIWDIIDKYRPALPPRRSPGRPNSVTGSSRYTPGGHFPMEVPPTEKKIIAQENVLYAAWSVAKEGNLWWKSYATLKVPFRLISNINKYINFVFVDVNSEYINFVKELCSLYMQIKKIVFVFDNNLVINWMHSMQMQKKWIYWFIFTYYNYFWDIFGSKHNKKWKYNFLGFLFTFGTKIIGNYHANIWFL